MADADETIITQFIVDAEDALERVAKLEEMTNAAKVALKQMADEGKGTFKQIADSMIALKSTEITDRIAAIRDAFKNIDASSLKELTGMEFEVEPAGKLFANVPEAKEQLRQSIAEARQEYDMYAKSVSDASRRLTAEQKEYIQSVQQGYQVITPGAEEYGSKVENIKNKIIQMSQASGNSFKESGDALKQSGENIDDINNALLLLKSAQEEYVQVTKQGYGELSPAAQQVATSVKSIKDEVMALAKEQNISFSQAADKLSAGKPSDTMKIAIDELKAAQQEYIQVTKQGYGEMSPAAQQYADYIKNIKTEIIDLAKQQNISWSQAASKINESGVPLEHIKVSMKELSAAQQEYIRVSRGGFKDVLSPEAQAYAEIIQRLKIEIQSIAKEQGVGFDKVAQDMVASGRSLRDVTVAAGELRKETVSLEGGIAKLGETAKYVFVTVFGITVVGVIRNAINGLKEATQAGFEFAQSLYRMEVSTRALQRVGLDITIKEVYQLVDELGKRFGIFTKRELIDGISFIQLLTRNLGFTEEQLQQTIEATTQISILTGKDFNEAARSLALFLSSGYSEAMQRAGLSVNRVTVEHEAALLGINKAYTAMNEEERAAAALQNVLKELANVSDDVAEFQDTLAGQLLVSQKRLQELRDELSLRMLPTSIAWSRVQLEIARLLVEFGHLISNAAVEMIKFTGIAIGTTTVLKAFFDELKKGTFNLSLFAELPNVISESIRQMESELRKMELFALAVDLDKLLGDFSRDYVTGSENAFAGANEAMKKRMDEAVTIADEMYDKLLKEQEKYESELERLERDLKNDLEKIDRDNLRKRENLLRDFLRRTKEISLDGIRKEEEARLKAQLDIAQTIRQFNLRRQELEAKYRERQIKAEIDYQEKLRRLREGFLFDLEDALRERDALQVLRLVRRFNLERDQLEREKQQNREELRREYELERQELERQSQERLRILQEELQARIDAIRRETQYALEENRRRWKQEKEDEQRALKEKKTEREIRYEEQKEEEKIQWQGRNQQILDGFLEQYDITEEMATKIRNILAEKFGKDGEVDVIYDYLVGKIQTAAAAVSSTVKMLQNVSKSLKLPKIQLPTPSSPSFPGFAEGGSFVAKSPQTIQVAEKEPEFVSITPLSKLGSIRNAFQSQMVAPETQSFTGMSREGKLIFEMLLSPDLEARIQENTLGQVADVMFTMGRKR